jgi:hypothetical protein
MKGSLCCYLGSRVKGFNYSRARLYLGGARAAAGASTPIGEALLGEAVDANEGLRPLIVPQYMWCQHPIENDLQEQNEYH